MPYFVLSLKVTIGHSNRWCVYPTKKDKKRKKTREKICRRRKSVSICYVNERKEKDEAWALGGPLI